MSDETQFIMALAVGMNTAAEVARRAGYQRAAEVIWRYERDWSAKVSPKEMRVMQRGDLYPPQAARWATPDDFGLPPSANRSPS